MTAATNAKHRAPEEMRDGFTRGPWGYQGIAWDRAGLKSQDRRGRTSPTPRNAWSGTR